MSRAVAFAGVAGLCVALVGCGGSPPPPPAAATPKPVAAAIPTPPLVAAAQPPAPVPAAPLVPMPPVPDAGAPTYDAKNRRDPFEALDISGGPKGLQVSTTKLTGIIRGAKTTLALVETQDGIGYILKPGDMLGDGRLVEIAVDSVIFAVAPNAGAPQNRVVLKLAAN